MAAHLSRKIRWDFLADYVTPYSDHGITLPIGDCGRIHVTKKKHQIQVDMRKYITGDMLCEDKGCQTSGKRLFRRNDKKGPPFSVKGGDEKKLIMFMDSFYNTVHEFARTELHSPAKPIEIVTSVSEKDISTIWCEQCNGFINHLEFGNKQALLEYSEAELKDILACQHGGGHAVGNSIHFFLYHIMKFYIYSNLIVHLDLREEHQWPEFMRPESHFRRSLLYACAGQTFLPYSRQFLDTAMTDLNETRELSKRLFRCIHLSVMVNMKLDSSYKLQNDFEWDYFRYF